MLTFEFRGPDGSMKETETLTAGMVGKQVYLEFSEEWAARRKTAVFTNGDVTRDVYDVSDVVTIPAEVLRESMRFLYVGIYGTEEDGSVIPTVWAEGPCIMPGADPSGDETTDPERPIWQKLQDQIDEVRWSAGTMTQTARTLLFAILRNGVYTTDQSDNITAFAAAFQVSGGDSEDDGAGEDVPVVVCWSITAQLTGCTIGNGASSVTEGSAYTAALEVSEGFTLESISVTMGGVDVTAGVYADGVISIPAVTGDVVITAVAAAESEAPDYPFTSGEAFAIEWTDGYLMDQNTGDPAESASFSVSDYLPVSGAAAVTLGSGVYNNYGIFFYTGDKTYLCRHNVNLAYPASVPRNAAYLRISARTTGKANAAVTPHVYELLGEQTVWESGKYYGVAYHPGISLNASTGAEAAAESWWASGHCFCYGAETLTVCEYNTSYRCTLVFYDAEKNYISGDTNSNRVNVAIPENAVYFRIAAGMITSTDARFGTDNPWITLS